MSSSADGRTKVLFLNTATLAPLGADTWIHVQIIRDLDRRTHEVLAACNLGRRGRPTPTAAALREVDDVEVVPVSLGTESSARPGRRGRVRGIVELGPAVWSVVRLARLIRARHITIIHTSDRPRDALAAVVLGRLTGATSIVHVHVGYDPRWMGRVLRWALGHADRLLAISEFVAQTLTDGGLRRDRIEVVLNGIDVTSWQPGAGADVARASLGIDARTPLLLTVCRLFPEKGPADVIEVVARLRDEVPGITLLVVGTDVTPGGWFSRQMLERVAELGLGDQVRFLGRRPDVEGLMAAADVFVMPSFEEPFGLVFCEAMAMERPVVGLANGGTPEVVEDGVTGLLSKPGDLDALTADVARLLAGPEERAAMGAAGRRRVEERFTTQHMAARTARAYQG